MEAPSAKPRRAGARRRAQAYRAEARTMNRLLRCFAQLQHRGCSNSILGAALELALSPTTSSTAAAAAAAAAAVAAAVAPTAPARPPGIFFPVIDAAPATTAYAQPAYAAPTYVAPTTTAYAQPAYAAPPYAAPATTEDEQPPIIDFEGGVPVPLRATSSRQPLVKDELYHIIYVVQVEFLEVCMSEGHKGRTQMEKQRFAKAISAIEILNLICSQDLANG